MRLGGIAAHDQEGLGSTDIVVAVGHRAEAPGIGHARDGRRMADTRLMVGVVAPPERRKLAKQIRRLVGKFSRAEPIDRFGAGLSADLHQLVADPLDGLRPRDPQPLAVDEPDGIFEATFAAHELADRSAFRAVRSAVDRAVPRRLLADPESVLHLGGHRAADRTMRADALAGFDANSQLGWRPGLGLAHGAERQRPERAEGACRNAGPAKEIAPIDVVCLGCEWSGERALAGLSLRLLAPHRTPPQ